MEKIVRVGLPLNHTNLRGKATMKVTQIWMSMDTQEKSRYGLRTLGGIFGIAVLALSLIGGGIVLGFSMGWPMQSFSLILCVGVTALAVVLAVRLGGRSVRDAAVFFLTEEDRLFVSDARNLTNYGKGLLSYAQGVLETQQFLRRLAQSPGVPAGADEILQVESIKENRSHTALICQVRRPNGRMARRAYFLDRNTENRELLLRQLERREGQGGAWEKTENRNPLWILLSLLVCCGFSVLCVLSHPAVEQLPQSIYFPCLGAAFAALCCVVWFGIRQHRGE